MKPLTNAIIETVSLPSKGMIYADVPESFTIRPMTVNELKILYGSSNTMSALNAILSEVINVENFPVSDLIAADKLYLAYKLRSITFAPEYKTSAYCKFCHENVPVSINLEDDIEIKYLPDGFTNPFSIGKLPVAKDEIELRMLTSSDFDRIMNRSKEIQKKFPDYAGDPMYPITLSMQIETVNGKKLKSRDKEEYVLNMAAMDDLYINQKLSEIEVGPTMPIEIECPKCGSVLRVSVALGEDFFRPRLDF